MISLLKKCTIIFLFLSFLIIFSNLSYAQTETPSPTPSISITPTPDNSEDLKKRIEELKSKIADLQGQEKTLSSQISVMNSQIQLTTLRINSVKQEIATLTQDINTASNKISNLEEFLNDLTKILFNKIVATYEIGRTQPLQILLSSNNAFDFFKRANYLRIAQAHDKKLVFETQQAKNDYANQKEIFEDKKKKVENLKKELESYTAQLDQEKAEKQELLRVTKNDEAMYQRLLAQVLAERAIVSGGGKELFLRDVNAGDSIATVITGQSGCSTGTHLHFSVYQGLSMRDPNDYLSSKSFSYSYKEDLYGYYGTINPHGSYPWPLDDPIQINQGFGSHGYASRYPGGIHDGIDMEGGSMTVKAVRPGKLYQGSYGGCSYGPLNYVKVEHEDGLNTWYLHVIAN